jgi:uncharacterized protein YjbJ (UPF0337 family)
VLDSIRWDVSLTPLQRDYKTVAHISAIELGTAISRGGQERTGRLVGRVSRRYLLQEHVMSMNKDQVKGRIDAAKGTVKQVTGKLVGSKKLQAKGNIQENLGKVQGKYGDLKKNVKDSSK